MSDQNEQDRVCRHLLLSSPPGQFDLILGDLTKVISSPLSPSFIQEVRNEYNESNNQNIITSEAESSMESDLNTAIAALLKTYMESNFAQNSTKGVSCSYSCEPSASLNHSLDIKTRVEKINLKNLHAGSWSATYTYDTEQKIMTGNVKLHAHYFENGNVQLQSSQSFDSTVIKGNEIGDLAKSILSQMKKWEDQIMRALSNMFDNLNDSVLKSMRRVLPVSRVKMDWNLRKHRMAKTLNKSKKPLP